jgi:hypothetical protein
VKAARRRAAPTSEAGRGPGERFTDAADGRLPVIDGGQLLRKAFPDHWSFLLGELALYSLLVLVLSGVWLTLFFKPEMREVVYDGRYVPLQVCACRRHANPPRTSASMCAVGSWSGCERSRNSPGPASRNSPGPDLVHVYLIEGLFVSSVPPARGRLLGGPLSRQSASSLVRRPHENKIQ